MFNQILFCNSAASSGLQRQQRNKKQIYTMSKNGERTQVAQSTNKSGSPFGKDYDISWNMFSLKK